MISSYYYWLLLLTISIINTTNSLLITNTEHNNYCNEPSSSFLSPQTSSLPLRNIWRNSVTVVAANMKAIRVHQFGGPEVLKYETDVPVPTLGPEEVLVRVKAVGVNPVDTYIRSGAYARKPSLPYTPGSDCAGIIQEIGSSIPKGQFKVGQRVYTSAKTTSGSYAEYTTVPVTHLQTLPEEVSFEQGASLGVPYLTAYRALMERIQLRPGDVLLVHGASGGVGVAGVQIGRAYGATVIGTAGTKEGEEIVRKAGAHYVLNHRDPNYTNEISKITNGSGLNAILENNAHLNLDKDLKMISQNGRIAVVGNRGTIEINPRDTMAKEASILGVMLMQMTTPQLIEASAALKAGMTNKWLNPIVGKVFPLSQASKAHDEIINGKGALGKLVLTVD